MNLLDLQSDPKAFRQSLLVDTDDGPRRFDDCMDPWQRTDFEKLDSGWQRCVKGAKQEATYQRGWLERGRGHAKTLDLAVMSTWALFASRRRLSGYGAAGDHDQAKLLRDAIGRLLYINPWLSAILEVQASRVVNTRTQSVLEILTSDAPTSYVLTPDFVIADEVVHWRKRDLWDSLLSSSAKRATCMLVCISNAGLSDDWQWQLRESVRTDPSWYFSRLDGPQASWITEDRLAEQERLLPSIAYHRLWLNEWTSGGGDALTPEVLERAFVQDLKPQTQAQPGFEYVAGVDLGVSRDASAVCVLGVRRQHDSRIRLAHTRLWRPSKDRKVDLTEIENALYKLHLLFGFKQLNYDPWEARGLAARLQSGGMGHLKRGTDRKSKLPMVEITPSGQNLQAIASCVIEAFNDYRLELYDDVDLKRDLNRLRIEERSYGFRLVSPRDEQGHGDMATAFGLAMLAASELATKPNIKGGSLVNASPDDDTPPFQRFAERWQQKQQDHLEYQEHLHKKHREEGHQEPFRAWMRQESKRGYL